MTKRLPKAIFLRSMLKSGMLTPDQVKQVQRRLEEPARYQAVNDVFLARRGSRFVNSLRVFSQWLWKYREEILRVLGFIIMFADDGKPQLQEIDEKPSKPKRKSKIKADRVKPHDMYSLGVQQDSYTPTVSRVDELQQIPVAERNTKC